MTNAGSQHITMTVIYGFHSVLEALLSNRHTIEKVILAAGKKDGHSATIQREAEKRSVPVQKAPRETIDALAAGKTHQGIICIQESFRYTPFDELLGADVSFIVILDRIQDPHNFGSLIRTAHCFGVDAIITPERHAAAVTPTVKKVAAGAAEYMRISRVVNIGHSVDILKKEGYWIYGADMSGRDAVDRTSVTGKAALILGGEHKGIRPLVKKKCDYLFSIPMMGRIDSLNVAVAGGIILYHMASRRRVTDLSPT